MWAVTLVALGLLTGFILQPAFGRSQAYATFYPVVFLAAYALGPRPAAIAAGLSAAVAYWCFVPPAFQWKWDGQVGSALAFFLGTSAVAIYLIDRGVRILSARIGRRGTVANVARVNAVIFGDLGARKSPYQTPITAPAAPRPAAVRPSERSFDSARLDRESHEAAPAERPRSAEAVPVVDRSATLH